MIFEKMLAKQNPSMDASAIREILKVVSRPGMISLAGGIPSPDAFPMDILPMLIDNVMGKYAHRAFQYDLSEGFTPLREALVGYLKDQIGIKVTVDSILIGSGSQGILDGLGKILISKGDRVAMEAPTYLGAIQAFNPYQPTYRQLETDADGLIPDSLERVLKKGGGKFIYLVPTFQNPTGRTLPLNRRIKIAQLIQQYHALLIEDDPYSALRYHGEPVQTIHSLAPENVVYLGTLSKVFAPGLRIGFCVAPDAIRKYLIIAKQGVDLHTATFSQALSAEYITGGFLSRQLPLILAHYAPRHRPCSRHWMTIFRPGLNGPDPTAACLSGSRAIGGRIWKRSTAGRLRKTWPLYPGSFSLPGRATALKQLG